MDKLKNLLSKYKIADSDKNTYLDGEPRNYVADKINPYLENIGMSIPKLSIADRKEQINSITDPENAVLNMGMGSVGSATLKAAEFNPELGKRIADAFKDMKHDPTNPEVKSAYSKLSEELLGQYDDMIKSGIKVDKIKGENPYKTSKDLHELVAKTNELKYFPTEQGFGSTAAFNADNPLMVKSGRVNASGDDMLVNDVFRAVHDYQGHVKPQASFGPKGEELAYQNHKMAFSPEAQKALATETRGQNSFVNFGDNAAFNKANPKDTIFADQKVGLLPDWAINENQASMVTDDQIIPKFSGLANYLKQNPK